MDRHLFLSLRLWAAAMLAVIGLQAIPVHSLPERPTQGSAFSASTVDVALAAREVAANEVALDPVPEPHHPAVIPISALVQPALQLKPVVTRESHGTYSGRAPAMLAVLSCRSMDYAIRPSLH